MYQFISRLIQGSSKKTKAAFAENNINENGNRKLLVLRFQNRLYKQSLYRMNHANLLSLQHPWEGFLLLFNVPVLHFFKQCSISLFYFQ